MCREQPSAIVEMPVVASTIIPARDLSDGANRIASQPSSQE
jgi:hypothetical protein